MKSSSFLSRGFDSMLSLLTGLSFLAVLSLIFFRGASSKYPLVHEGSEHIRLSQRPRARVDDEDPNCVRPRPNFEFHQRCGCNWHHSGRCPAAMRFCPRQTQPQADMPTTGTRASLSLNTHGVLLRCSSFGSRHPTKVPETKAKSKRPGLGKPLAALSLW